MSLRSSLVALAAIALFGATPRTQNQVCVTGVVRPESGPSICTQRYTHALENTRVKLVSRVINLDQYVGRNVKVMGPLVGVTCPIVDVAQVFDPPPATLEFCGTPQTSCPVKLKLCPIGMGRGWLLVGFGADFVPVGCSTSGFLDGSLLVANPILVWNFGAGVCGELLLIVPTDPSLLGLTLWFQGARQDIGPIGPLELSNVTTFRITPFMPPCGPVNC